MGPVLVQLGQKNAQQEYFHLQPTGYDKCCHVVTSTLLPFPPTMTVFSLPEETGSAIFDTAAAAQHGEKVKTGLRHLTTVGLVKLEAITACELSQTSQGRDSL